jgi:hypothetical protein
LTHAQDSDLVALADAGGKIRVALRNPFDEGTSAHHAMALPSIFSNQAKLAPPAGQHTQAAATDHWEHPVQLHVQVLNVTGAALEELSSHLGAPLGAAPGWHVGSFRSAEEAQNLIQTLREKRELDVLSGGRLMAGVGRPISYRAGAAPSQLRVQFAPELAPGGAVSLRVKPEISIPSGSGVATSKYEAGLAPDSSFLFESSNDPAPERLFPGSPWEQRHLLIFVAASSIPGSTIAMARTAREH